MSWQFYFDRSGKWRWRVRAENGRIIGASSQGYRKPGDCADNAELFGCPTEVADVFASEAGAFSAAE